MFSVPKWEGHRLALEPRVTEAGCLVLGAIQFCSRSCRVEELPSVIPLIVWSARHPRLPDVKIIDELSVTLSSVRILIFGGVQERLGTIEREGAGIN